MSSRLRANPGRKDLRGARGVDSILDVLRACSVVELDRRVGERLRMCTVREHQPLIPAQSDVLLHLYPGGVDRPVSFV